jgi:hypothetical protein
LNHYNGNVRLAVAALTQVRGAVDKYNGIPPYQETQTYVNRVELLIPATNGRRNECLTFSDISH